MDIAVIDLETYWDAQHSLSKMSPIAYCMHPDTEIISCAFKFVSKGKQKKTEVIFGEDAVKQYCAGIDWSKYFVIGHNMSGFDSMILAWRLGVNPKLWGCTLSMAKPLHSKDVGCSLAALVEHYGIGKKDNTALMATRGRHLCDFTQPEIKAMGEYNAADVDQCYELFRKLLPHTPKDELKLIDMTVRMLVEPKFEVDMGMLTDALAAEHQRRKDLLVEAAKTIGVYELGMTDDEAAAAVLKMLSSAPKFAKFLETMGVTVPKKVSPTTGKLIPALSKTDEEFINLQQHENEVVAAAASARLDAKSTILHTRIQAFIEAANACKDNRMPIPLKYYGADTTGRWSGWAYNPQNLPRIPRNKNGEIIFKPSNVLRLSLRAPEGYKVVVADLSGIELRVNHFLWQAPSSMKLFKDDPAEADLYKDFASKLYDVPIDKVTKPQRQVGKVAHLGLGFGAGAATFQQVARMMGGVEIDLEESQSIVTKWRQAYPEIVQGWKICHNALPVILRGAKGESVDPWGMVYPVAEGLHTPRGVIRYPKLRNEFNQNTGKSEYMYGEGRNKAKIYAGKIDENIVQHLARCIIADNALTIQRQYGLIPSHMVHDELIYIVPEDDAEDVLANVQEVMRTSPEWWPALVTWSEGDIADTYGDAK